ncbi:putative Lysozyme [metagenome]|uniref:Putative Lysozyme n=1 Tax=metagenome TaxID=256318 RepID=A0A2P2CBQ9_9ZZZZ
MAEQTTVLTTNGLLPAGGPAPPLAVARPAQGGASAPSSAVQTFRLLTANVQSFPPTAITLDQAREDLRANAADGDLVLLQEIDTRYRRLVLEEFPRTSWQVFFGPRANHSPIAVRRDAFDVLDEHALQVHPGVAKVNEPRYLTHVHLRHRALGVELHAVNLHLVSGAFHKPPKPDAEARQAEWRRGMEKHDRYVARLVATGAPVVCGGDYNRQLRAFRPQIQALGGGRRVSFGVDLASIDLIWFVDGVTAIWAERGRATFRSREGRPPRKRNSDHAARQATLALARIGADTAPDPVVIAPDGSSATKEHSKKDRKRKRKVVSFTPQGQQAGQLVVDRLTASSGAAFAGPVDQPFTLTEFGDTNPKRVDWKTRAALEEAERRLDYRLTVVQGSYNNGRVKASGPTHDGGGVVDLLAWDWRRKVTVLREIGFAAWYRPARPGLWGAHIHAVLIEHGRLDASAAAQVVAYRAGRDGLKGGRSDDFPRPSPIPVFSYPPAAPDPTMPADGEARRRASVAPLGRPYPPNRSLDGIDISHHQSGRLDLTTAKRAGLRWMYVKATEGTSFKDKTHRGRVRQARSSGLPVGAYHFARPEGRDAAAEARFFLANIDLRAGDMVPMLDLEDIGDLTLPQLTEWTGVWVRTVNQEIRRKGLSGKPLIYTPFNLTKGFGCLLWVARYSDDFRAPVIPTPWKRAAIWQHSNGRFGPVKTVPGIGHVDVNAMHPDLPLSALRLRPAGRPARPGRGTPRPPDTQPMVVAPVDVVTPAAPVAPVTPAVAVQPAAVVQPATTQSAPAQSAPTVTTSEVRGAPGQPGAITVTVTVPVPPAPAPLLVHPDLGPLEEQLALAARSLQGAIEAVPERPGP